MALPDVPIGKIHPALVVINNRFVFQIGGFDDFDYDIYRLDMAKPDLPWQTLTLDNREAIVDDFLYAETRSYLLEVREHDRIQIERKNGRQTGRDSEDDSENMDPINDKDDDEAMVDDFIASNFNLDV